MPFPKRGDTQLPTIKLDTTLTELYKLASPRSSNKHLAHIHSLANCGVALGSYVPRNKKFLYQDGNFVNTPLGDLESSNADFRRSLSIKYLSIIPQRDAFISGDSSVILFDIDSDEIEQTAHGRQEVEATMAVLERSQKPRFLHCPGPHFIPREESRIDAIASVKVAIDGLEGHEYPLNVELEKHWFVNSKAALAGSGLPAPRTEVIEVDGYPSLAKDCCDVCRAAELDHDDEDILAIVPNNCEGPRGDWVREREQRIFSAIAARCTPFVLKTQQTFGGSGTWIVRNEQQRDQLLNDISRDDGVIRRILSQVNDSNQHLHPGHMILSDYVKDVIGNYGITLFVTDTGDVIFMGVAEQLFASDGKSWTGNVINYEKQCALRERLKSVMEQTAQWLSKEHGYHGPVGIDILEAKTVSDADSQNGEHPELQIVDLNVRVSGSMSLPLLKSHFTSRGLHCASISMVTMKHGRWDFIARWKDEFESGRMVIISWHYDQETDISLGSVVVGGENEARLHEIIEKVHRTTKHVTF